ncbi:hypothetical protein DAEQUDRAFT_721867 [Daedalea quercina L-15889]|uniref:Uncharacterized protein n=1 Tax=Daedalea quercina L-15889 TaxID=1314783 RepID=A0A165TDE0_9APHY|nr:hypothetical protein DAEQUDRAFT_721867 [Daedalea quercina L-15889]
MLAAGKRATFELAVLRSRPEMYVHGVQDVRKHLLSIMDRVMLRPRMSQMITRHSWKIIQHGTYPLRLRFLNAAPNGVPTTNGPSQRRSTSSTLRPSSRSRFNVEVARFFMAADANKINEQKKQERIEPGSAVWKTIRMGPAKDEEKRPFRMFPRMFPEAVQCMIHSQGDAFGCVRLKHATGSRYAFFLCRFDGVWSMCLYDEWVMAAIASRWLDRSFASLGLTFRVMRRWVSSLCS